MIFHRLFTMHPFTRKGNLNRSSVDRYRFLKHFFPHISWFLFCCFLLIFFTFFSFFLFCFGFYSYRIRMLEIGSNGWQKYYRNDKRAIGGKCNPWHTYVKRNGEKEERKTLAWAPCKLTYLTDNPWRFSGCHRHASSTKPFEESTSTPVFPNYNWFRTSKYDFSFINIKLLSSILILR